MQASELTCSAELPAVSHLFKLQTRRALSLGQMGPWVHGDMEAGRPGRLSSLPLLSLPSPPLSNKGLMIQPGKVFENRGDARFSTISALNYKHSI